MPLILTPFQRLVLMALLELLRKSADSSEITGAISSAIRGSDGAQRANEDNKRAVP